MNKNTRWALAIVGVAILIIAAFVISSGKDDTKAVQEPGQESTVETGPTPAAPVVPDNGATGSNGGDDSSGGSGTDDNGNSGGASPDDSGNSGGSSPGADDNSSSGGAEAQTGVVSPLLTNVKVQTVIADKGETVELRGLSQVAGEIHVHGYDKEVPLKVRRVATIKFKATIDGTFPIEFHLSDGSHADVGTLRVNP